MAQEIERKFLVLNDSYKRESFSHSRIQQGYITSERGRTVRIRIRDEKAAEYPEATMWGQLPAKGFYVRHVRSIHFDNIEIHSEVDDARQDIVKEDVK